MHAVSREIPQVNFVQSCVLTLWSWFIYDLYIRHENISKNDDNKSADGCLQNILKLFFFSVGKLLKSYPSINSNTFDPCQNN